MANWRHGSWRHRSWRYWLLAACCSLAVTATRAEVVPDLYTVAVPVPDQSSAALQGATTQALRELVVRVSGRSDAANNTALVSALANARGLLSQYRYDRRDDGWVAQLTFGPESVRRLLRNAGLPVWGADRPVLRVLLVVDDGHSQRFADSAGPLIAALSAQAQRRGVLLAVSSDTAGISPDAVARLDVAAVQSIVPARGALLLGSIRQNGTAWSGNWLLTANGQQFTANSGGATLDDFIGANFDSLIDALSAQYAAAAGSSEGVVMQVGGVENFDDYAALLQYLQHVSLIRNVTPILVYNDQVQLQLSLQGSTEQLARQIALEKKMVPAAPADAVATLSYRWAVAQ